MNLGDWIIPSRTQRDHATRASWVLYLHLPNRFDFYLSSECLCTPDKPVLGRSIKALADEWQR
jgi:hypothetical protein